MIRTTLVIGSSTGKRESIIASDIDREALSGMPPSSIAILLEGFSADSTLLAGQRDASSLNAIRQTTVTRIAQSCPCCVGNLTMRISLDRLLRRTPQRLYIGIASLDHLNAIRSFMTSAPYVNWLTLTEDLAA